MPAEGGRGGGAWAWAWASERRRAARPGRALHGARFAWPASRLAAHACPHTPGSTHRKYTTPALFLKCTGLISGSGGLVLPCCRSICRRSSPRRGGPALGLDSALLLEGGIGWATDAQGPSHQITGDCGIRPRLGVLQLPGNDRAAGPVGPGGAGFRVRSVACVHVFSAPRRQHHTRVVLASALQCLSAAGTEPRLPPKRPRADHHERAPRGHRGHLGWCDPPDMRIGPWRRPRQPPPGSRLQVSQPAGCSMRA